MGERMYRSHVFLTSALAGGDWSVSRSGRFTHGERDPDTHRIGVCMGPVTLLDTVELRKILALPGIEIRHPSSPYYVAIPTELSRFLMHVHMESKSETLYEVKWSEAKWGEVKWSEVKCDEDMNGM
jgi:hypothetical protein